MALGALGARNGVCCGLNPLSSGLWCCSIALLPAFVPLTGRSADRGSPPQLAINWWHNESDLLGSVPVVLEHDVGLGGSGVLDALADSPVVVWRPPDAQSGILEDHYLIMRFGDYISEQHEGHVITLPSFQIGALNAGWLRQLDSKLRRPVAIRGEAFHNYWVTAAYHDTGLHYDDYRGCVRRLQLIVQPRLCARMPLRPEVMRSIRSEGGEADA